MRLCVLSFGFRLVDVRERLFTTPKVALAHLDQDDTSSGSIQEASAQLRFKVRYCAGYVGRGGLQSFRRSGKASEFCYANRNPHVLKFIYLEEYGLSSEQMSGRVEVSAALVSGALRERPVR